MYPSNQITVNIKIIDTQIIENFKVEIACSHLMVEFVKTIDIA